MSELPAILIPERKSAYVEIAKVGSSSIKAFIAALLEIPLKDGDPHATELPAAMLADLPSDYFVFAFVRNPWDRLVSCYRDKVGGEPGEFTHLEARGVAACFSAFDQFYAGMTFGEFVTAVAEIPDDVADEHFRSQHTFVTERVDFLGRFECLEADFSQLLARLRLQGRLGHRQVSPGRIDFRRFYTQATVEAVAKRYAEDIELFGYWRDAP